MYTTPDAAYVSINGMAADEWEPRSVAYHEAGHAVVAWLTHLRIDQITINADEASAGHVLHEGYNEDNTPEWNWGPATKQRILDQLQVCLAGAEAQRKLGDDEADIALGAAHDRYESGDHMLSLTGDLDEQVLYWNLLKYQVKKIIEANWNLIEALAEELLQCETMSGDDVSGFLLSVRWPKARPS